MNYAFLLQKQPEPAVLSFPPQIPNGLEKFKDAALVLGLTFGLTLLSSTTSYTVDKPFYVCTQNTQRSTWNNKTRT